MLRKIASIVTGVALIIGLSACGGGTTKTTSETTPEKPATLKTTFTQKALEKGAWDACTQAKSVIYSSFWHNKIVGYANSGNSAMRSAYAASDYTDKATWTLDPTFKQDYMSRVDAMVSITLKHFLKVNKTKQGQDSWTNEWRTVLFKKCGLTKTYVSESSLFGRVDDLGGSLVSLAADAPWYPQGYSESPTSSNIAYKWSHGGDDCYECSYWTMDVISDTDCTSGVYAEINILDSSSVAVDWTNDDLPYLGTGQIGRLTFETYESSAQSARLVELTCHDF